MDTNSKITKLVPVDPTVPTATVPTATVPTAPVPASTVPTAAIVAGAVPVVPETLPSPVTPSFAPSGGEGVAEKYVSDELKKARATLRSTQIGSVLALLVLALYMGYMTERVVGFAQPPAASEITTGIIAERVNDNADSFAANFQDRLPAIMEGLPQQAIAQMPAARQALTNRITSDLNTQATQSSAEMGQDLDTFLDQNKDQVKTVLDAGSDPAAVHAMGPELRQVLSAYLAKAPEGGGDSIKGQIDKSLQMLDQMRATTARLAANRNLTPEEQKTRLAIALISRSVGKSLAGINVAQAVVPPVTP